MRMIAAGILTMSFVLAACGTNQTGQNNQQQPLVKKETQVEPAELVKQIPEDTGIQEASPESSMTGEANEEIKPALTNETAATTSDNSMISDKGVIPDTGIDKTMDDKSQMAREEDKKEVSQKTEPADTNEKEPKS